MCAAGTFTLDPDSWAPMEPAAASQKTPHPRATRLARADTDRDGMAGFNTQRPVKLRYFFLCRIRLRIRRFLRPTLRRPLPRLRLAMRSPLGIDDDTMHGEPNENSVSARSQNANSIRKSANRSRSRRRRLTKRTAYCFQSTAESLESASASACVPLRA
jgi:hypothetical protein